MTSLPEIAGGWETCSIELPGRVFEITRPAVSDALLEAAPEDSVPYWTYLWPAAYDFAGWILQRKESSTRPVLEIGSGIGLCGLAGLAAGRNVEFSDYDPVALTLSLWNAKKNGFSQAQGRLLDWRRPAPQQYGEIWGCEVTYDPADHQPLVEFLKQSLAPTGIVRFVDSNRAVSEQFAELAGQSGFIVQRTPLLSRPYPNRPAAKSVAWEFRKQ